MKNPIKAIRENKRRTIVYAVTIALAVAYLFVGNTIAKRGYNIFENYTTPAVRAVVTEKHSGVRDEEMGTTEIVFLAKLSDGDQKGKSVTCLQTIDDAYAFSAKEVSIGDKVLIYENTVETDGASPEPADTEATSADAEQMQTDPAPTDETQTAQYAFSEYQRTNSLLWLMLAFFACLILFGGRKGFNTIVSLGFTVLSVFLVFLPACLSGQNIYAWTIATCVYIILMTLLIVYGVRKQSVAAAVSCFAGMLVCGGLTALMSNIMKLTGLVDENSYFLTQLQTAKPIDLNAITFGAITIGAIGAVMDVSISISSSLQEVDSKAPNLSRIQLMGSGMTIGRDMMGTMANTLVLAYIGSSLAVTLILVAYQTSIMELLNRELIVTELLQILVGSFGILLTIPLTSFISSLLYKTKKKKVKETVK